MCSMNAPILTELDNKELDPLEVCSAVGGCEQAGMRAPDAVSCNSLSSGAFAAQYRPGADCHQGAAGEAHPLHHQGATCQTAGVAARCA